MPRCLLPMLASAVLTAAAVAQPTTFTLQGRLDNAGSPTTGLFDLRFRLFDAAAGGAQVGATQCADNVTVSGGLFAVQIDFGQQFITTGQRFLEIDARPDAGLNCSNAAGFTLLTPRQPLTAAPLANHAKSAFALDAADGSPANAVFVDNVGKVGVGTLAPTHSIHIATIGPTIALQDTAAASQQAGYVSYRDNANVERAWVGYGTPGSPDFSIVNARTGGDIVLLPLGGGNVGIGTGTPSHSLHIANTAPTMAIQDTNSTTDQVGYVSYRDAANAERAWVGYGTPGSPHFSVINARAGGDVVVQALGSGGNIVLSPGSGGVVRVPILEITGADLAEKFPASEELEPGMVVAIDKHHAGKLCLARGEYNRCVAGVVSGANDFAAGAVLGNLPGHADAPAVALSGRVYVWCDASQGAIEPGDLLTTSPTPGHAMKATDRDRSHGAVIGKAMTGLSEGRGMVLVLVNLQ